MKRFIAISIIILFASVTFTTSVSAQGKSGKEKPQKQHGNDKQERPAKPEKGNPGKDERGKSNQENHGKANNGAGNSVIHANNGNKNNNGNGNRGKGDKVARNDNDANGYKWDRQTFKERKTIRNGEKVNICHKFNNNNEPGVTIKVSANALKAHMAHGDVRGTCPAITNNTWSDAFLSKRSDYYNRLEDSREQVTYSRSILDYALERLATSRQQLALLQANNAAAADIQRKQQVVAELEQNTSVLQTLINATATLLINKLTD